MGTFILKRKRYGMLGPATIVTDSISENLINRPAEAAVDTVNEVDTERDLKKMQQKQYGVAQAAGQILKGTGKGLLDYGKKNKGTLTGLAKFGAVLGAGSYGMNRLQRQKAEIDAGEREATGMSTGGKAVAAGTALGTGALVANATGKSHDKSIAKTTEAIEKGRKLQAEANSKGLTKIADKASKDIVSNTEKLDKLNRTRVGGVSNKAFKMGRNGLIAGGIMAGAGLLANSMLKQKNNSLAAVGKLAKRALGGKTVNEAIKSGDWNNLAKAGGTYVTQGARSLVKGASNFFTPGKNGAGGLVNNIRSGLSQQGEYGKKAADFIGKHKTAAMAVGAGTVGAGAFNLANKVGETPVNLATKLDKKTSDFVKKQQEA